MKRKLNFKLIAIFLVVIIVSLSTFLGFKFFGNRTVLKSENFSITSDMMSYLIQREAEEYIDYHKKTLGSNFSNVLKLSLDKNLKRQKSPYNKSWYDYFHDIAYEKSEELISINEEVLKQKITFSEDINAFVEKESKSLIKKYKIGSDDLKQIIRLEKNAEEYKKLFEEKCSEETFNRYYENNRKQFDRVDYKKIIIGLDYENSNGGSEELSELLEAAEETANNLAKEIQAKGFDKAVQSYLSSIKSNENIVESVVSERYKPDIQFSDWAFDSDRKIGDVKVFAGKNQFSIYYITKTMYPYDYVLANAMIYQKHNSNNNQSLISELGTKWKKYENTQKGFSKFAKENKLTVYGEQPYAKDDLPEALALWVYSSERKPGDFDCYEMGEYVYVMRFEDFSGSYFKTILKKQCIEHEYQNHLTELLKKYKIEK